MKVRNRTDTITSQDWFQEEHLDWFQEEHLDKLQPLNSLGYHIMQVDTGVSDECTTSILIISNLNTDEVSA